MFMGRRSLKGVPYYYSSVKERKNHQLSPSKCNQRVASSDRNQKAKTARSTGAYVLPIMEAISSFVNQERLVGTRWETPAQHLVTRRLEAEVDELRPYLSMWFKLHRPRRRP
jgi:hypothetical protein